jgi:hypothetical protein
MIISFEVDSFILDESIALKTGDRSCSMNLCKGIRLVESGKFIHEPSADPKERFLLVVLIASFDVNIKQSVVALSNNRVFISFATVY